MSKNKNGRPEWFKFWRRNRNMLDDDMLSMESRGKVFTNIMRYFDGDTEKMLEMTPLEEFAFKILKQNADEAVNDYEERSEINKKNGSKGGRPPQKQNEPN